MAVDAVFFEGEDDADDPWRVSSDDDVPLLKRRLRHSLGVSRKKNPGAASRTTTARMRSGDPASLAADKGKAKVVEVPAKVAPRVGQSKKKWKDDGDPGSSKGAKRQKKKAVKNKDDILVNEAQGRRWSAQAAAGMYKGAANSRKRMHGGRPPLHHHPDMEAGAVPIHLPAIARNGVGDLGQGHAEESGAGSGMKKHHPGEELERELPLEPTFSATAGIVVMRVKTKVGQRLSAGEWF
ncbi:unnamed protein product [Closterium sp. NIES-65]|nr:unnamed protein product [Closterium sp. NIES-65]